MLIRTRISLGIICLLCALGFAGMAAAQEMMMDEMDEMDGMMMEYMPPPQTCKMLPEGIMVDSETFNIQCQQVSGGGIGIPSILELGVMDAVDVWGPMEVDAEVCFAGSGSLTFLDSTTIPKMEMPLEYSMRDGMTCADIVHPGTVILLPSMMMDSMDDMDMMDSMDYASLMDDMDSMVELEDCEVATRAILNFRAEPGGEVLGGVDYPMTLTATGRTDNWFMVEHDDAEGWISAHYVDKHGDCG